MDSKHRPHSPCYTPIHIVHNITNCPLLQEHLHFLNSNFYKMPLTDSPPKPFPTLQKFITPKIPGSKRSEPLKTVSRVSNQGALSDPNDALHSPGSAMRRQEERHILLYEQLYSVINHVISSETYLVLFAIETWSRNPIVHGNLNSLGEDIFWHFIVAG